MSGVVTAMISRGLAIERFEEYADNISATEFDALEEGRKLPLSYVLGARRA